jgi:flagellar protein FliO/FliZ
VHIPLQLKPPVFKPRCQLLSLCLLFLAGSATATTTNPATAGLSATYLVKTVVALCLVLVVIFLLSKLLRNYGATGQFSSGQIRVLAGTSIGSREKLLIVQAGETQMLLGVGPAGIVKLETFERPVIDESTVPQKSFKEQLSGIIRNQSP